MLYRVFETKSLVPIALTLVTNSSYAVFLTPSFFTTFRSLRKSSGTVFDLLISISLTCSFNLAKSTFLANFGISTPVTFFRSDYFLHN